MDAVYTDNHIEGIIQIKIVMAVEIASDKLVNLALAGGMQIMELVHGLELDDIQAIWQDAIRFSLQQMLQLVCNDVGDSGKNVCIMCRGTLNAVVVVNTVFSSLVVDVKVLEVVVEIDTSGAEVSAEESCVSSKDSCDVDVTFATERNEWQGPACHSRSRPCTSTVPVHPHRGYRTRPFVGWVITASPRLFTFPVIWRQRPLVRRRGGQRSSTPRETVEFRSIRYHSRQLPGEP